MFERLDNSRSSKLLSVGGLATPLLAVVMVLFAGSAIVAQTATGSINGSVTDPSGAAIAGAKVTLVNTNTNESRNVITNGLGYYSLTLLPPGQYRITVRQAGFR